ncbi:MAG: hypothetical protein WD009_07540 [Phycisphaeraceae bacterium]
MIANLLVLAFVLFMAYYWATQGLYSAFMHLCIVLVAGTIAFALWEPLSMLLLDYVPRIAPVAWGLGLILPFLVALSAMRLSIDKLLPGNMQFMHAVSLGGGGVCGGAAGILTAGVIVIGLSFLPVGTSLAGYQPYAAGSGGRIESTEQRLWINVDGMAASVFTHLSRGPFHPVGGDYALADAHPDLRLAAGAFRLQYDPRASLVVLPDSVELGSVYSLETPVADADEDLVAALDGIDRGGERLVVIDTIWRQTGQAGTYDADGTLRVPPTQIRLAARARRGDVEMHAPVAFVRGEEGEQRTLYPLQDASLMAHSSSSTAHIGWVFLIPAEQQPHYVRVRNSRFDLPDDADAEQEDLLSFVGRPYRKPVAEGETGSGRGQARRGGGGATATNVGTVGHREGTAAGNEAVGIEQTNRLPAPFSRNHAPSVRYQGNSLERGQATVEVFRTGLAQRIRIDSMHEPTHLRMVRLRLDRDQARSLLGAARARAASITGVALEYESGEHREPIGWALLRDGGDELMLHMDMSQPIRAASELPIRQMVEGDELYLYFTVPPQNRIIRYHIGGNTTQQVDLFVE